VQVIKKHGSEKARPTTPSTVNGDSMSFTESWSNSIKSNMTGAVTPPVLIEQSPVVPQEAAAPAAAAAPEEPWLNRDEDELFGELKAWLEEHDIDDIDADDLPACEEADISDKELDSLPDSLCLLGDSVLEFALEKNNLQHINNIQIGKFTCLTELYLRDNQITELPKAIGDCEALDSLYLENNLLTSLPAELGNLKNLKGLCLHRNQFVVAPASIFECTSLEELYLDGNCIAGELPPEVGKLVNLKELGLANNKMGPSFPETIGSLKHLHTLHAEHNQYGARASERAKRALGSGESLGGRELRRLPLPRYTAPLF
jgi:Leucine-rich repeat (LRR) protein